MKYVLICVLAISCAHKPKDYRTRLPVTELALAHPAGGALAENTLYDHTSEMGDVWFSLTELTDRQICIDQFLFEHGLATGYWFESTRNAKPDEPTLRLRSPERAAIPTVTSKVTPVVLSSKAGVFKTSQSVDTGRRKTVCTNTIEDRFGHTVGCRESEEQAITEKVAVDKDITIHTTVSALRWCTPNQGMVTAATPWLEVTVSFLHSLQPIKLVLSRPASGAWGGRGGRDAFAAAEAVKARGPASEPTAGSGTPTTGSALVIAPVQLTDRAGKVVAELTADGSLMLDGRLYARFHADGRVESKDGVVTVVVDEVGAVRMGGKRTLVGSIARGTLHETSGGRLTIEQGRYRYVAKGRDRRSGLRITKGADDKLLLVIGFVLANNLSFEK